MYKLLLIITQTIPKLIANENITFNLNLIEVAQTVG